jgi:hypothetical protein
MTRTRIALAGLVALLLFLLAGVVWAGSSDNYAVEWWVMSGGGAPAASGNITLNGSLGQTAIGPSAGGGYDLGAGYWYGLGGRVYPVYLPIILRNY